MRSKNIVLAVLCVVAALAGWYYYSHTSAMATPNPAHHDISVGGTTIPVEVVSTESARQLGLSGRAGLAQDSGMLFVFDTPGPWGIWMKDMQFSIDIVWLSDDGTVLTVVPNAAPDSYPQVFYPSAPARYVVELPAGFAAAHGIREGSKFQL